MMVNSIGHLEAIRGNDPLTQMGGLALDFVTKMVPSPLAMFFVVRNQREYVLATVKAEPILGADPDLIGRDYLKCTAKSDPFMKLVNGHRRTNLICTGGLATVPGFEGGELDECFFSEYELGPVVVLAMWDEASSQHCLVLLARSRDESEFSEREKTFLRQVAPLLTQSYHCAIGIGGQTAPAPSSLAAVLTPRELEIAMLAAQGARNSEIAEKLSIAHGTVKTHMHSIYSKLGVDSRVYLALGLGVAN